MGEFERMIQKELSDLKTMVECLPHEGRNEDLTELEMAKLQERYY